MFLVNNKHVIFSFILSSLPILLITGPFLTDLIISFLALSFFFLVKEKKYYYNYFTLIFILFCIIIIISSLFSKHIFLSLESSLFYFRFGFFSLFFWYLIESYERVLRWFYNVLLFCFVILILDSMIQHFTGSNILNMKIIQQGRISSFFGDELKMGSYLFKLFPLVIGLSIFFFQEKKSLNIICLGSILILMTQVTIYLSGERTSFFLFNFSVILFLIFLNDFVKLKKFFILIFSIFTILLFNIDTPYKKRLIDLTINQFKFNTKNNINIFSDQHQEHYFSSWKMFKDNKLIGIGPKNFRERCKETKYNLSHLTCSTHPHNFTMQLLAETGVIGFSIYLISLIVIFFFLMRSLIFRLLYKKIVLSNLQISLLIGITVCFWPLAPSGSFFNNWNSAINYLLVPLMLI